MTADLATAGEHGSRSDLHRHLWGKSQDRAHLPSGGSYPLICHLLDTAGVARAVCDLLIPAPMKGRLAQACGSWDAWVSETVLCAGAHDLGKATCLFQQQSPTDCPDAIFAVDASAETPDLPDNANRHAYASGLLLWDYLRSADIAATDASRVVQIVGGHHGTIPAYRWDKMHNWGGAACVGSPEPVAAILHAAHREMMSDIAAAAGDPLPVSGPIPLSVAAVSHAVVVLADWIASSSEFLAGQASCGPLSDPSIWAGRAERRGREHMARLGLVAPSPPATDPSASCLLDAASVPSPLQASLDSSHPRCASGITIITAPTGEGKTEAALLAASRYCAARGSAGWYFAMPTMGTADGLRDRLERLLPTLVEGTPPMLNLMHSLRALRETPKGWAAADPEARHWATSSRKAILAPFGVGTIDQALLGVLRVKHSPLRMLAATTGTLIVDEAHTFDPYMRRLLCRLLQWCAASAAPVVLMSATLPQELAAEFFDAYRAGAAPAAGGREAAPRLNYPGWACWTPDSGWATSGTCQPLRRWRLGVRLHDTIAADMSDAMARRALEATRDGGCVMVVRESVVKSQQTYEAVISAKTQNRSDSDCEVVLLHSRFRHNDRRRLTERLLADLGPRGAGRRPARLVLVATQIVEMSLDVDFDLVMTDPAPAAALLQRAGRCHRHVRPQRPADMNEPTLEVFWPLAANGEPSRRSHIYLPHDLAQARKHLADRSYIDIPDDVSTLVDAAHTASTGTRDAADDTGTDDAENSDYLQWLVEQDHRAAMAASMEIPTPDRPAYKSLTKLTGLADETDIARTRLGAAAVQILAVYPRSDDTFSAERPGGPRLPEQPDTDQERRLYERCVPVTLLGRNALWPLALHRHPTSNSRGPRTAWKSGPLAHVRLLPMDTETTARVDTDKHGTFQITLDGHLGLRANPDK